MKKTFESGKIWTLLSALIFIMTCGMFVLAGYINASRNGNEHFDQWLTTKMVNTEGNMVLTGGAWDNIMDSLNSMVIPMGAIMAFTGDCPRGWTRFSQADGRFLMGATHVSEIDLHENSDGMGGSTGVTLTVKNLPEHSHLIEDTVMMESASEYGITNQVTNINGDYRRDVQVRDMNTRVGIGKNDHDNSFITVLRKTSDRISLGEGVKGGVLDWSVYDNYHDHYPLEEVDITNPYVKVIFCRKTY